MKKDKILITINNIKDIKELKELGITKYVFPLKDFCVGIPNTFLLEEINETGYLYINRILDNDSIDRLKNVLSNLNKNIVGIIFDDLGILEIIKDLKIEKILYLSHFNNNCESVNIYLDYVDSVILSTDITKEEIESIVENSKKELILFTYGYVKVMYSRRLLVDNYNKYYEIESENPLIISNTNNKFIVYENEYGTVFYHEKYLDGTELFSIDAKYYFFNTVFMNIEEIKEIINGKINPLKSDKGFLYKETIYKLKEE